MEVVLNINNENHKYEIDPGELLIDTLRKNGYLGPKKACSTADCGACIVIIDGNPVNSCLAFTAGVIGKAITTIEGIGSISEPHPIQKHFIKEGAVQCGYCIPGMIMSSKALLDKNINPSEDEVKQALSSNLCRCTGYVKQIKAVLRASEELRGKTNE